MIDTGAIILAAGRSSRLGGGIKQLLPFRGKTLLQHTIDALKNAGADPVVVVTGAHAEAVSASLDHGEVDVVFNEQWEQGKASGIVAGVRRILDSRLSIQQVIIAVCDQPFVSAGLFEQLAETQQHTGKSMVACAYAGAIGIPVLLTRDWFDRLLALKGDEGAKKILKAFPGDVATVDFPLGHVDVDTVEDYAGLGGHLCV